MWLWIVRVVKRIRGKRETADADPEDPNQEKKTRREKRREKRRR